MIDGTPARFAMLSSISRDSTAAAGVLLEVNRGADAERHRR